MNSLDKQVSAVAMAVAGVLLTVAMPFAGPDAHRGTGEMVLIPAGSFTMGADERDGRVGVTVGVDSLPRHERQLPAFRIDRYEVTNEQYREFLRDTGRKAPADPRFADFFSWREGRYPAGLGKHPVVYVDWSDARDYCAWRGKRLPTEAEWEKAARGTDARRYPMGNEAVEGACNTRELGIEWTVPVGTLERDVSPYGVHDMCGNVSEWTADWYQAYPGSTLERPTFGERLRVARGGAWNLDREPYSRTTHRTLAFRPDKRHRGVGFRCAESVKSGGSGS